MQNDVLLKMLEYLAAAFIFVIGLIAMAIVVIYVIDRVQTKHAIRHNFPVVGHFRYFFEKLGEFFRQYFFSMDREEMPFNRAQRSWAYRAAKDIDNTVAFGSTRSLNPVGTTLFVNSPFPALRSDCAKCNVHVIGPACRQPYATSTLIAVSGMSYGAISAPAVRALSRGAKKAGIWLNTGEGGLTPYHLEGGCDIVFQIGTARNGVRNMRGELDDGKLKEIAAHEQVRMFELKLSQGAKPGKGGILPGAKVTEEIARIRGIEAGKDAISPNRHLDIKTNDDLIELIHHIREVTGKPVGFKAVISDEDWLDELFSLIYQRGSDHAPDFIAVDGGDGGTGAAPLPLIDAVGLPLRESLPMLVDKLIEHGLRDRVKVIASGKLVTPADVAWALCLGADFCVTARGFMFALGCIQALQCNRNTCPTGITTHDPRLQRGLDPDDKSVRVANYARNLVSEVGIIAHSCGLDDPRKFTRRHVRIVMENGLSMPLQQVHPVPQSRMAPLQ